MKKAQSVGLIGAGSLTDSPLTRFWFLPERLGPVKSATYRVASRIANMLQAGRPVKDYAEFDDPAISFWFACRRKPFRKWSLKWCPAAISWPGKAVVLCSTWLDSGELARARRAAAPRSDPSAPFPALTTSAIWWKAIPSRFASPEAWWSIASAARSPSSGRSSRFTWPRSPAPAACCLPCSRWHLKRCIARVSRRLSRPQSLERQLTRTLRSFLKGGRRAYPEPRELPKQLRSLSSVNSELAYYLEQSTRLAAQLMSKR